MAATQYTVPQVPGSSRKSEHVYTHAVIGRFNAAAARLAYATAEWCASDRKNYAYFVRVNDKSVAGLTVEQYVAERVAARIAAVNKAHGLGEKGELVVLQWSRSAVNAQKALGSYGGCVDLAVVPCVPVVK